MPIDRKEAMSAFSIQELPDSLVITRPRRNGCAVVFLLVWLTGWTSGLVHFLAEDWSAPLWNAVVPMVLIELVTIGVLLYSLAGRERLIIRPRDLTYEHSAIVTFDRCIIRMEEVEFVDLLPLDPTSRRDHAVGALVITGGDSEIRFGEGLSGQELHEILTRIRHSLDEQRVEVAPAVSAAEVAPISHAEREVQDAARPESLPVQIGRWLTVPFFITAGCAFVYGGASAVMTGHPLFVLFGLFFACIGLFLSAGLTWASLSVFRDWLRRRRNDSVAMPDHQGATATIWPHAVLSVPHAPTRGFTRADQRPQSWNVPVEAILFVPAIVIALVFRFRSLPWDQGGWFFQVWLSLVGLGVLAALPKFRPAPRAVAAVILVPNLCFLQFAALRFAVQTFLPFIFLAGIAAVACYLWSRSKLRLAALATLALIPIAAVAYFYGLDHMRTVNRLRTLLPQEIKEVRIEDHSHENALVIRDRETLGLIAKSLGDTSPYSPQRESISRPLSVTIRRIDGSTLNFRIGKGNRAHPNTVWIEFGLEVYQNPTLYPLLQSHDVFAMATSAR